MSLKFFFFFGLLSYWLTPKRNTVKIYCILIKFTSQRDTESDTRFLGYSVS